MAIPIKTIGTSLNASRDRFRASTLERALTMRFHRQECLCYRNHRRAGAEPGFDLCGSSHLSHPKTADLESRFAHRWLRASHLAQLDYPAESVVNCSSTAKGRPPLLRSQEVFPIGLPGSRIPRLMVRIPNPNYELQT